MLFTVILGILLSFGLLIFVLVGDKKQNKKLLENGVELWATVKKVDFDRKYDCNNNVESIQYMVTYEFTYKELMEKTLTFSIPSHPEKLKEGDKILCLYDPEKDLFDTKENVEKLASASISPVITVIAVLLFILLLSKVMFDIIINGNDNNATLKFIESVNNYNLVPFIMILIFALFALVSYAAFKNVFNHFNKNYITVSATIIEVLDTITTNSTSPRTYPRTYHSYMPVVEFYYSGKTYVYILNSFPYVSYKSTTYTKGEELEIKFNPDTLSAG